VPSGPVHDPGDIVVWVKVVMVVDQVEEFDWTGVAAIVRHERRVASDAATFEEQHGRIGSEICAEFTRY